MNKFLIRLMLKAKCFMLKLGCLVLLWLFFFFNKKIKEWSWNLETRSPVLLVAVVNSPEGCKICLEVKPSPWGTSASTPVPTLPSLPVALKSSQRGRRQLGLRCFEGGAAIFVCCYSTPLSQGFWKLLVSLWDSQIAYTGATRPPCFRTRIAR